jgi:hypothetical protein
MDLNSAYIGTSEATRAIFTNAAPTTMDLISKSTTTIGNTIISVGTGGVDLLKIGAKFAVNIFFPGSIA